MRTKSSARILLAVILSLIPACQFRSAGAQILTANELETARAEADKGQLEEAESTARRFLKTQNESAKAHFLLAYILFRERKPRESLAELTEGAKYQKPSATDLRVAGADYVLLGDYTDADKWFTRASEWEPENVLGLYYLGRTKYNENRFEEAVKAFEQCLKLSPRHVSASDNLGLSLQALARNDEARRAFLNAIEWQVEAAVKSPWPYIDFGSFLLAQNQPEEAKKYLKEGVRLAPDLPKAHEQLGKAYLALQGLDEAQAELERAVALEPDSPRAHYILGQLYTKHREPEKAKREFAKYAELNARRPAADDRDAGSISPN